MIIAQEYVINSTYLTRYYRYSKSSEIRDFITLILTGLKHQQ